MVLSNSDGVYRLRAVVFGYSLAYLSGDYSRKPVPNSCDTRKLIDATYTHLMLPEDIRRLYPLIEKSVTVQAQTQSLRFFAFDCFIFFLTSCVSGRTSNACHPRCEGRFW